MNILVKFIAVLTVLSLHLPVQSSEKTEIELLRAATSKYSDLLKYQEYESKRKVHPVKEIIDVERVDCKNLRRVEELTICYVIDEKGNVSRLATSNESKIGECISEVIKNRKYSTHNQKQGIPTCITMAGPE